MNSFLRNLALFSDKAKVMSSLLNRDPPGGAGYPVQWDSGCGGSLPHTHHQGQAGQAQLSQGLSGRLAAQLTNQFVPSNMMYSYVFATTSCRQRVSGSSPWLLAPTGGHRWTWPWGINSILCWQINNVTFNCS